MNIKNYIEEKVKKILQQDREIVIEEPPKEEMGDYSIQCASYRTEELKTPMEVASYIKENFADEKNFFSNIKTIGPYLNFYLNYDILAGYVIHDIENRKDTYGSYQQGRNQALLIEHTSINPNAEPHIGRCRNSLIGDFMSRLYQFTGYEVERHYFINDLGKKIALLIIGVEKYGLVDDDFSSILDIYVKINQDAKNNPGLEKQAFDYLELVESGNEEMIQKFKSVTDKCVAGQLRIFDELNISFDVFTHESDYVYNNYLENILDKLRKKGRLHEDELGRYYVDLSGYDIPTREPVLVLTRSNKTSLYPIKDIAYTMYKMDLNSEHNFIVLGEDQEVYMKQISAVLDILGYKAPHLISYSYVLLDGDKMSTSGGTVVLVTDFVKAVMSKLKEDFGKRATDISDIDLRKLCNACIKFSMLNVSRKKIVNFNLESATSFTGESGMYILYSIVRINSILRASDIAITSELQFQHDIEFRLLKKLYQFPELVDGLLQSSEPAHLTKYLFNLTQDFSRFYESVPIMSEEDAILKSSRIRLLYSIKTVVENGLSILGIDSVDKM